MRGLREGHLWGGSIGGRAGDEGFGSGDGLAQEDEAVEVGRGRHGEGRSGLADSRSQLAGWPCVKGDSTMDEG